MQKLEDHLPREEMLALQNVVRRTSETVSEQLADTHARKIGDLMSKVTRRSTVVDQEKWVVNISKRVLTPVEITALKKRSKFLYHDNESSCFKNTLVDRNGYLLSESISQSHDTCLSH